MFGCDRSECARSKCTARCERFIPRPECRRVSREVRDRESGGVCKTARDRQITRIETGSAIADVGAGTGLFTRLFADAVGKDGQVLAVDIAEKFLQHIDKTNREAGRTNVQTVLCTADSTKLPMNSVDAAYICDTYHHFEFPLKTMTSLHQALKPSGRVFLIDFKRIEGESSDWTLNHVRAGQDVFEKEILSCGFKKVHEYSDVLKDNYFVSLKKSVPTSNVIKFSPIRDFRFVAFKGVS